MAVIWRCDNGEFDCVASLEGHENEVKAVSWSRSGQFVATCGRDKSVFIWEAEDDIFEVASVLHSHTQDVKSIAWHPQRDVLASASYDDTLKVFTQHGDDWRCHTTLTAHTSTVWCLAFSADGRALVSCSDDRSVVLWRDAAAPDAEPQFERAASLPELHDRPIFTVDWCKTGSGLIATGGGDDAVCLLRTDPTSGPLEPQARTEAAHDGDVNCVAWSPASNPGWLVTAGDDGTVKMWRCEQ